MLSFQEINIVFIYYPYYVYSYNNTMYGFVFDAIRLGCFKDFNKKMWQDISKVNQQGILALYHVTVSEF